MNTVEALVAGEIYIDLILSGFDFWPLPGQEAFARDFQRELGGGAAITACGLAALGTRTGIFGVVGADHYDWISTRLEGCGVEIGHLQVHASEPTGFTVAISAPEDRTFFTYRGANHGFPDALHRIPHTHHVHLAYAPPWKTTSELFAAIHGKRCTLSLDAGWHEQWLADPRALEALAAVDVFFPNESEAARMTGETDPERILRRFADAGLRHVALKLGARGAALLSGGEILFAPPIPVTPIDTTGAGDNFDAGFLHAWLRGDPPAECLRIANLCGALSTEAYGGIAAQSTFKRILCEK